LRSRTDTWLATTSAMPDSADATTLGRILLFTLLLQPRCAVTVRKDDTFWWRLCIVH
jgi:hypothetical protein